MEFMQIIQNFPSKGIKIPSYFIKDYQPVIDKMNALLEGDRLKSKYGDVAPILMAVGDGNHSLATAKACYEELKKNNPGVDLSGHPARFALVVSQSIRWLSASVTAAPF